MLGRVKVCPERAKSSIGISYLINELRSIRVRSSINRFVRFRIMMGKMLRIKCEQMQQISWTDSRKSQIWYSNIFRFKRAFDFEKNCGRGNSNLLLLLLFYHCQERGWNIFGEKVTKDGLLYWKKKWLRK